MSAANVGRRAVLVVAVGLAASSFAGAADSAGGRPHDATKATAAAARPHDADRAKAPAKESEYLRFVKQFRPDVLSENPEIRERMAKFWYYLLYPTGTMPDQPLERAREHVQRYVPDAAPWKLQGPALPQAKPPKGSLAKTFTAPGDNVWVEYGPKPLDGTGTTNNAYQFGIVSGRLNVIASDPTDRGSGKGDRAWLGYATGGLWRVDGIRSVTCSGGTCNTSGVTVTAVWDSQNLTTQAVSSIEIDPSDATGNTVYVGTGDWDANDQFSAGIMKTTDGGATWTQLAADVFTPYSKVVPPDEAHGGCVGCKGNRWSNQDVKALKVDPHNPSTLIAGTRYDLYISHDSGTSWQLCPFGNFSTNAESTSGGINAINRISSIALDSRGATTTAYVAVGFYVKQDSDNSNGNSVFDNADNGVYSFTIPSSGCPTWPGSFTTYFGGMATGTGTTAAGTSTGRIDLTSAIGSDNKLTLYAQVSDAVVDAVGGLQAYGTYVMRPDGVASPQWTLLTGSNETCSCSTGGFPPSTYPCACYKDCTGALGNTNTDQDWYDLYIRANPKNDKDLYIGHVDTFRQTVAAGYGSIDIGSNNAANITNVYGQTCASYGKVHPDEHGFAFVELGAADANYGNWILLGNDGGIYLNTASGNVSNWARLSGAGSGISSNQFYEGQVGQNFAGTDANSNGTIEATEIGNPTDNKQWLLGGMQDNGCATWDSSRSDLQWTARGVGGDGFWTAFDSLGGSSSSGFWITEVYYGDARCATGATGPYSSCQPAWSSGESADWSAPIVMDQFHCTNAHCSQALVGGDYVYGSTAYPTPSWTRSGTTLLVGTGNSSAASVVSLGYYQGPLTSGNSAGTVVAGTDNAKWWRSQNVFTCSGTVNAAGWSCTANGSATWAEITASANQQAGSVTFPNRVVAGVSVDPTNDNVVYAAVAGFGSTTPATPGHVYRAVLDDVSGKFLVQDKTGNLPDVPAQTVQANPNNPNQVFVGTLWGFYYTDDITQASPLWVRYMSGPLPNAPIFHLTIDRGPQSNPFASTSLVAFTYGRGIYAVKLPPTGQTFCTALPSAPVGVSVAATTANKLDITWNDSSSASVTQYRIYRATTAGGPYTLVGTVSDTNAASYTYQDSSLSAGTTYYYVVRAVSGGCESANSTQASASPFGDCTTAPTFAGVQSVAQIGNGQGCGLRLTWNVGTANCTAGALSYNVYRATTSGFTPSAANRVATCVGGATYDDTTAATGTTYYYVVRAEDGKSVGSGPCGGGVEDTNTTQQSGVVVSGGTSNQTLYTTNFDTAPTDWGVLLFNAGSANGWSLITGASSCARNGSNGLLRNGGTCTGTYANDQYDGSLPAASNGIAVPAGATNTQLNFWHKWTFTNTTTGTPGDRNTDGGFLRVQVDGLGYNDLVAGDFVSGGYNGSTVRATNCATNVGSGGKLAWIGTQASYQNTVVNLDAVCARVVPGGCAGHTVRVAFTMGSDCAANDVGWFIDDVSFTADVPSPVCSSAPVPVGYITSTGKDTQVTVQAVDPVGSFTATRICHSSSAYPADPGNTACPFGPDRQDATFTSGGASTAVFGGPMAPNGNTQYFSAFVNSGGVYSGRKTVAGYPFAVGTVRWNFVTGAAALTPPLQSGGVGLFAGSNDRAVHAMQIGDPSSNASAGLWPTSWVPPGMNGPAQEQPLVLPTTYTGFAFPAVFVGSQDGFAYCFRADSGAACPGWTGGRSASLGAGVTLQATPMIYYDATAANRLLIVGTRISGGSNKIVALKIADGSIAWSFDNLGAVKDNSGAIGIVSGPAFIDAANHVIYFTSRASTSGGSSNTVWRLTFTAGAGGAPTAVVARAIGDIDGAFTQDWTNNRMIVGTNGGAVFALDPANLTTVWSRSFADGPVKDFVYFDPKSPAGTGVARFYFSTTSKVWSILATGATGSDWSVSAISPSRPLLHAGTNRTYIGACANVSCTDGRVIEVDSANSWGFPKTYDVTGAGGLGAIVIDRTPPQAMLYAGSRSGRIYAILDPLP